MKAHVFFIVLVSTLILSACTQPLAPAKTLKILPQPQEIKSQNGRFNITGENTKIFTDQWAETYNQAISLMNSYWPNSVKSVTSDKKANVFINHDSNLEAEAYTLEITPEKISITCADSSGAYYAAQTLRQIIIQSDNEDGDFLLPCVSIKDAPRFAYRGMHLDVCRHFFTVETIKNHLDIMGAHKFNRFHWHLTEDQGWRIEIKQYPKLTEVGSYRPETVIGKNTGEYDGTPHEGYYTQDEIREIIAYAHKNCIEVIPEIEMPGHSLAALTTYPELGCTGGPYEVATTWGVFDDVYCAGNDKTMAFMKDVLDEVAKLFPGEYIHIGGDECPKTRWKACPRCQKRMKTHQLADEHELQSWFIQEIEHYLNEKGKRIIGWDEILKGGLAENATVMSWRGEAGGIEAAERGHDVIMTPNANCYFDHYQTEPITDEPFAIGGMTTVKDVYNYEPIPAELKNEHAHHVLGAQANLWSEYIPTEAHLQYMMLPRATALSEVLWTSKDNKDYERFLSSIDLMKTIYETNGWNYAKHIFE
ncbi:MAG: beta-N-acetylhexosaminidase [Bacteroidota bacterium]|nr:beta-N-acetylhexosaminidase [Bacteroidota bacterium]